MQFNENCEELGEIGLKVLAETTFVKDRNGVRKYPDRRSNENSRKKQHQFDSEEKKENADVKVRRNKEREEASKQDALVGAELDSKQDLIEKAWGEIGNAFGDGVTAAKERNEKGVQTSIQMIMQFIQAKTRYEQEMQQLTRTRPM